MDPLAVAVVDTVVTNLLLLLIASEFAFLRHWVLTGEYLLSRAAVQFSQLFFWQQRVLKCASNLEFARELSLRTPLTRVRVVLPILKELRQVLLELDQEESADFKVKALAELEVIISELEVTKREGKEYFE